MPKVPAPVHGEGLSSVGPLPTEEEDEVHLAARMDDYKRERGEPSAFATTTCFNTGVSATVGLFSGGAFDTIWWCLQLPLPRSSLEPLSFTKYSHLSYLTSIWI